MPLFVIFDQETLVKHADFQRPSNISAEEPLQPEHWRQCACRGISLWWDRSIGQPAVRLEHFHTDIPQTILAIATADHGYRHTMITDQWGGRQPPARYQGLQGEAEAFVAVVTRAPPQTVKIELKSTGNPQQAWNAYWIIREGQPEHAQIFNSIVPIDLVDKKPT